jgi:hypothetical protein
MKKTKLLFGLFMLFAMSAMLIVPVRAHPPADMTLSYDYDNQILTVTVIHSVADVNTHYIERIIINKNGQFAMNRNYTSQASASSMSDTFDLDAADDDILQVTAICSVSGQIVRQVTVSSGGLERLPNPIPGFPIAAIAIGLAVALSVVLIRRRTKATT